MNYEHATTEQLIGEITGKSLSGFPRLREIAKNPELLLTIDGITAKTARRIQASLELGRRYVAEPDGKESRISSPEDVVTIYGPRLRDLDHERFYTLILDNGGHIMDEVLVSKGIVNASLVHPREVFKEAIRRTASSIILLHNHPSGTREASKEDHSITKQLVEAGRLLDILVQDHVIICGASYISFAENGWM